MHREKPSKRSIVITCAIILLAAVVVTTIRRRTDKLPTSEPASPHTKAYFTVDDGASYFVDDGRLVSPFVRDGKTAYLAHVFSVNDGKTMFVGYLERYTEDAKKALEDLRTKGKTDVMMLSSVARGGREVKAPKTGNTKWVNASNPAAANIISPSGPGTSAALPQEITP